MTKTVAACIFALLAVTSINSLLASYRIEKFQREAVERGYALHCPESGRWAWKGECDEG